MKIVVGMTSRFLMFHRNVVLFDAVCCSGDLKSTIGFLTNVIPQACVTGLWRKSRGACLVDSLLAFAPTTSWVLHGVLLELEPSPELLLDCDGDCCLVVSMSSKAPLV